MSAVIQLTLKERSDIRKRVFDEFRSKPIELIEILHEGHSWHKLYMMDDSFGMIRKINQMVDQYLERAGFYADAEREELEKRRG